MYYIQKQVELQKPGGGRMAQVIEYILKCIQCCMYCFERCLKYICKQAYIQIAINGSRFCQACIDAFMLILSNSIRYGIVFTLGGIIHYLGVAFIAFCTIV